MDDALVDNDDGDRRRDEAQDDASDSSLHGFPRTGAPFLARACAVLFTRCRVRWKRAIKQGTDHGRVI